MKKIHFVLILAALITASCGSGDLLSGVGTKLQDCPRADLPYPRPEPDYTGKLEKDFSPFTEALEAYSPEQIASREDLVSGKTILELGDLLEAGELTSFDLTVYYLERIQRYDVNWLNSVLELNPKALIIAQALDDERAAGKVRGPLHGIPVLLKDNIATGDELHTAAGAAALLGWDPDRDAFLVSQLREAGAVILGKANLSEWANYMDPCLPDGFSANGGQTRNPYGPFDTLGSSSGPAVAVAADLAAVSVGTETQGSIIQPAEINSVVGLKTSRGLVSRDYVIPLLPPQDVPGPLGRTVTDVAILLSALTGVDQNDPETTLAAELAGTDFTHYLNPASLEGVRVGVFIWNENAFAAYFEENGITDLEQQDIFRKGFQPRTEESRELIASLNAAGIATVEIPHTSQPSVFLVDFSTAVEAGFLQALDSFLASLGSGAPFSSLEEIVAFNSEDPANRAPYGQGLLEGSLNNGLSAEETQELIAGNQAAGEYSFVGNTIQIELGPTTLAACPEGSQGETFLELLPGEKEYQIGQEEGKTILALSAPYVVDVPGF